MDDMYREYILEHYRNPLNHGLLDPSDIDYEDTNPLCGDQVHLTLRVDENGIVSDVGWEGHGCAISQATASLLYDTLKGKSLAEVKEIDREDVLELLGVPLTAARTKCAILSLKVLKAGAYGLENS